MYKKNEFCLIVLIFFLAFANSSFIRSEPYQSNNKTLQSQNGPEKTYTVKRNESLKEIAGRRDIYNNKFAWPVLYLANKTLIKDQSLKLDGLTIKIPAMLPYEKIKYDKIRDNYFRVTFFSNLKKNIKSSEQFLIVTSKDWDSTKANMAYYEKKNGKPMSMSENIPVNLGRSGLGWGNGMIDFNTSSGPIKHEGDGKAPAGIFKLSYAFGYLPKESVSWLKYPYKQVTTKVECVDDTTSVYYNTLVDDDKTNKTWNSSEIMRREDELYKFGIFVEHNSNPQIPGCGSCIFIHIQSGFGKPTSGCTSLPEEQLVKLLHWLDVNKNPLLIQLPQSEFDKIKSILGL